MNNTFLAIIPARGGSKRLPRKNILDLCGKPLISYSIEAGLRSKYINKVVVTTEDEEIFRISEQFGAEVIKRPKKLSEDTTSTFDTIEHTINNMEKFDYIVLLQPTSPLRTEKHIDEAIELLHDRNVDAIISVCETDELFSWTNTLDENLDMSNFLSIEFSYKENHSPKKYYRLNGAIYICKTEKLLFNKSFFLESSIIAYIMDKKISIDIDYKLDFDLTKILLDGGK